MTAHWGVPDPAAVLGSDDAKLKAFNDVFIALHRRIAIFVALPFEKIQSMAVREQLNTIERTTQQ